MRCLAVVATLGTLLAIVPCNQSVAQTASPVAISPRQSVFAHVNHQAILARSGNTAASADLVHQLFTNVAIPNDMADAFGFTDRIVHAEAAYREGTLSAVHESDIVKAVNNMVTAIGAPM